MLQIDGTISRCAVGAGWAPSSLASQALKGPLELAQQDFDGRIQGSASLLVGSGNQILKASGPRTS